MKKTDIIRAWKSVEYRESLTEEARSVLPDHPAGIIEIDDRDLRIATGGEEEDTTVVVTTILISLELCPSINDGTCNMGGTVGCCEPQ